MEFGTGIQTSRDDSKIVAQGYIFSLVVSKYILTENFGHWDANRWRWEVGLVEERSIWFGEGWMGGFLVLFGEFIVDKGVSDHII